jgi:hypothetical protein
MHPDAESLILLAEQQLPAAERDLILAHMASCGRCREVVFLAQHAASEDQSSPLVAAKPAINNLRTTWLNRWNWLWIPAAAFAGFIGVSVLLHFRRAAPETQMTATLSQTEELRKAQPLKAPVPGPQASAPATEAQKLKTANPSEVRDKEQTSAPSPSAKDEAKQLDQKKSVERNELATAGAAGAPVVASSTLSGGSIHEESAARAKASPYDGPAASNQFQQQNLARQDALLQSNAQQSQNAAADAANKVAANKPVSESETPSSASQTVAVQADTLKVAPSPAAPPPQISSIPLTEKNYETSSASTSAFAKARRITLPSGLAALSMATEATRTLALDTAGALFLSDDGGKHWQPIPAQWTGRALLVRTRPIGTQAPPSQAGQTTRFELVNDKQQSWISYDGKTWTPEPPSPK